MSNNINFYTEDDEFLLSWNTPAPPPFQVGHTIWLSLTKSEKKDELPVEIDYAKYKITHITHSLEIARLDSIIIKTTYNMEVEVKRIEGR